MYEQYVIYRKILASRGVIKLRKRTKTQLHVEHDLDELSSGAALDILRTNVDVESYELANAWESSFSYRRSLSISDLMDTAVALREPMGYKLALMDCLEVVGSDCSFEFPNNLHSVIINYLSKKVKQQRDVKSILQCISEEPEQIGKNAMSLRLLPYCFSTPRSSSKSKTELCDLFIQHRDVIFFTNINTNILHIILFTLQDVASIQNNNEISLAYIGVPLDRIVVTVDASKYFFADAEEAIQAFIGFHLGLNIKYTKECSGLWTFVQKYIVKVHTNRDQNGNETLAADLGLLT